jgi:hypothetical protein
VEGLFFSGDSRKALWVVIPFMASLSVLGVDHHQPEVAGAPADTLDLAAPNGKDDKLPTLSIDDVKVNESDSTATFTITREGKTKEAVQVRVATSGIDATENLDYTGQTTTITIEKGGKAKTHSFTVAITDDAIDEATETFSVRLTDAVGATILEPPGTGTIVDNDTAGVTVDQRDGIFVLEGADADTLSVVLHSEPTADVVITASAAADQLIVTPEVATFGPTNWDTPQTISIAALQDGIDEPDPHLFPISFSVDSADPNYNGLPPTDLTATIGDADSLLVTIDGPAAGAPDQAATFAAMVNAGGIGTITYDWTAFFLGNDVATGNQATFQFTPNDAGSYNIQVIIGDDQGQNPATFIQFNVLGDITSSIFVDDIVWLAAEGITIGCNPPANDEFCPIDIVTREQMAAFLVRALGYTDDGGGDLFIDDGSSIFENQIDKLGTAGVTRGCNPPVNDLFCPDANVTRGQMAAFLARALGYTDNGGGGLFMDDDGSIFEDQIDKLATAGVTRGCNPPVNDMFCPNANVTRGQMAAFLHRALDG